MNKLCRITKTLKDKGLMVREDEVSSLIDQTSPYYQSLYYYGEDALDYFAKNKNSIKSYKGQVSTPYIVFDIDSKDLNISKQNTIILIDWLKEQGLYNEYAAKIAFSGSKGFHLTLNTAYEFSPKELKSLCMYISSQVPFIEEAGFLRVDPSIYNINRQFRIVNTINDKSGLFKIEMVESELRTCTMETIKEAAARPQKTYPFESQIDDKPIRAILLQLAEDTKEKYSAPKSDVIKTFIGANTKRKHCIDIIQDGDMKDGESNSGLLRLASHYRRQGYTKEQCREKLVEAGLNRQKKYPGTNEFTDEKLDFEILSSVYSTEGYIFTCDDWFLKMKCLGACHATKHPASVSEAGNAQGACNYVPKQAQVTFTEPTPSPTKVVDPKPVQRVVSGFGAPAKSFKDNLVKHSKEDTMKLSGFRTIKQSSDSFKSFADDWQNYRVITGIEDLDEAVRMLPTGLVIINAKPGVGKCLGKGTEVRMFDGTLKKVEDIVVGDLVMGPDSKSRLVTSLARGREEMFRVDQKYGMSYEVNRSHILSLKHPTKGVSNISVNDYFNQNQDFKHRYKGWKSGFELSEQYLDIPPYLMGAWLGDGHSDGACITSMDSEIVNEFDNYCKNSGLEFTAFANAGKAKTYRITGDKGLFRLKLENYQVLGNKHIPKEYLFNSRDNRLQLLAGLIDTDGHLVKASNVFEITQKNKVLAEGVVDLCQSLGLRATIREVKKTCKNSPTQAEGTYYRVLISGKVMDIPVRTPRRKPNSKNIDHSSTAFTLTSLGEGDYYGFTLEGPDRLFLLKDGTVAHNTSISLNLMENCAREGKSVLFYSIDMTEDEFFTKSKSKALKISPDEVLDLYFNKDSEAVSLQEEGDNLTEKMLQNCYLNYDARITPEKIDADLTAFKEAGINIDLVIIDYLQKMEGCGDFTSPRIGTTLMGLKSLQPKHKVCIIGLSQMPRAGGNEESPVLTAAAAKGGGVYEENASIVINLWRPLKFYRNEAGSQDKYLGYMIAKNRLGQCKEGVLYFKGSTSEIRSLTDQEKEDYEITREERKQREQPKVSRGFN